MNKTMYYCQPDGGHWNVEVTVRQELNLLHTDLVIITSPNLFTMVHVVEGLLPIMLVAANTLFTKPQALLEPADILNRQPGAIVWLK